MSGDRMDDLFLSGTEAGTLERAEISIHAHNMYLETQSCALCYQIINDIPNGRAVVLMAIEQQNDSLKFEPVHFECLVKKEVVLGE